MNDRVEWIVDSDLGRAWSKLAEVVEQVYPYDSFGVQADGPGFVAWVGGEQRIVEAWSIADPLLEMSVDEPALPSKALLRLAIMISEANGLDILAASARSLVDGSWLKR
jgi:hypothetical protein